MATLGKSLTAPEAGWKRYDDSDVNINYIGKGWYLNPGDGSWNNTDHCTYIAGDMIKFNFTGTRIRYISWMRSNRTKNAMINIDGTPYIFSENGSKEDGSQQPQSLVFEKIGLDNTEHYVTVTLQDGNYFDLDAIDIDETGELKPFSSTFNLVASAGDSQVTLTWNAVDKATYYNVKRSTVAGGPYTVIASNITELSYIDKTVTNGTTYYYVITANISDGESLNSNEASSTPISDIRDAVLRVVLIDSSDHDYQLTSKEIDGFVDWYMKHLSTDTAGYMLSKKIGTQNSKEYVAFDKIISFEVITAK